MHSVGRIGRSRGFQAEKEEKSCLIQISNLIILPCFQKKCNFLTQVFAKSQGLPFLRACVFLGENTFDVSINPCYIEERILEGETP